MFLNENEPVFLELCKRFRDSNGVTTDTRSATIGQLYFALRGEHFDGNQYAHQALDKGCTAAVVDDPSIVDGSDERFILVPNVLNALQSLARWHRRSWDCPVIGLTGSNGKTTTKELIKIVLEQRFQMVHATAGNFNNEIGVPLTILAAKEPPEVAIIEMGANAQKEIALLADIAEPTIALITNIGRAHLDGFGGEAGVLKGKGELFDYIRNHPDGRTVFVNAHHNKLVDISNDLNRVLFGKEEMPPFVHHVINEHAFSWTAPSGESMGPVQVNIMGEHNRENIMGAVTIGIFLGVSPEACSQAIAHYIPQNNRSQWIQTKRNRILLDAYNANPSSVIATLDAFGKESVENGLSSRPICILGEMGELGSFSKSGHLEVLQRALAKGFEVFTVGMAFQTLDKRVVADDGDAEGQWQKAFSDVIEALAYFQAHDIDHCLVLLKGSRSVALEQLVEVL